MTVVLAALPWSGPIRSTELSRDTVKAGFLFNFAQFASWPTRAAGPIAFCVEEGSIEPAVFNGWSNSSAGARAMPPTRFRRADLSAALPQCDIVYLDPATAIEEIDRLLAAARQHNVLLVADAEGFARRGGHIELYLEGNQYRFRINLSELRRSGVVMSSKVLRLADVVDDLSGRSAQ